MRRALFLDKDGTLVRDVPYNGDPAKVELNDEILPGLRDVQEAGYELIVVSNQPGIAHGYFAEASLRPVVSVLRSKMAGVGLRLAAFYYCPHHEQAMIPEYRIACECRKPEPGMFYRAAEKFNLSLENSWMIGDILDDVQAGKRAGCRSILLDNGNETEWVMTSRERHPDFIVRSIDEGCHIVLREALTTERS
jgi:D,D-heptose 1,7-bisphosphate phosphatase